MVTLFSFRWLSGLWPDARQHAVFGGDPAVAGIAEPARHPFFYRRGDEHPGVAETGQARSFGVFGDVGLQRDDAKLVGGAAGRP